MENDSILIYGKHAVVEAVRKRPEMVKVVHVRADLIEDATLKTILNKIPKVEIFTRSNLPKRFDKESVHQGVIAEIDVLKLMLPFKDFKLNLNINPHTSLVVLGEVQDPHNVGAIIRSATAFGAAAVLVPEHRGCPITGTVIKVSAGTAFSMPLVSVGNVNNALRDLKKLGFWVYGLDGDGEVSLSEEQFSKPSVFVVGNEATGMRLKTHAECDTIIKIPMSERAESLNASVSAAVTLYAWSVQHPIK
jgi:23S rRNA (guanosine2251-2'-O)-methyltransferase